MLVQHWDTDAMGPLPLNTFKIFAVLEYPEAFKADLINWSNALFDSDEGIVRKRTHVLDLQEIASELGDASLYDAWAGSDIVEAVDLSGLSDLISRMKEAILTDYSTIDPILDSNAVTSGTHTISGSGSPDYATQTLFESDVGNLTEDIVGRLIGDTTEVALAAVGIDCGGFDYTMDSDTNHGGDQTAGHQVTINHDNHGWIWGGGVTNAALLLNTGYRIKRAVAGSDATKSLIRGFNTTFAITVHHMMLDGNGLEGRCIWSAQKTAFDQIYVNLIWDAGEDGIAITNGAAGTGYTHENNTIRNAADNGLGVSTAQSEVVNNSISFTNGIADFSMAAVGSSSGDNNATTDATADDWNTQNNNNINLTETDQVESTDDTDGTNFMRPKATGVCDDGGRAPDIAANTTDLAGQSYDGTFPIGCYMIPVVVVGGGSPIGNLYRWQRNRQIQFSTK